MVARAPAAVVVDIMMFGNVPAEEAEVVIRLDRLDGQAHICSTWAAKSRLLERRYGEPSRVVSRAGIVVSAWWVVPVARISFRSAPRMTGAPRKLPRRRRSGGRFLAGSHLGSGVPEIVAEIGVQGRLAPGGGLGVSPRKREAKPPAPSSPPGDRVRESVGADGRRAKGKA